MSRFVERKNVNPDAPRTPGVTYFTYKRRRQTLQVIDFVNNPGMSHRTFLMITMPIAVMGAIALLVAVIGPF